MKTKSLILFLLFFVSVVFINAQGKIVSYNNKQITYEGRVFFTQDAAVLSWPGTSVYFNFRGTSVEAVLKDSDTSNYYNIIIDGKLYSKLHLDTSKKVYLLASGLKYGNHRLQLYKRTEWDKGKTYFYGLGGYKMKVLPATPKPKRKIEFFGNSITCGYAIEDYINDSNIGYYENSYDTYAAITARHFNAQCHSTSKSGIGITISWFPLIMKEMYDRLDATDSSSKWNFLLYQPDVVVINLLQNDSWLVNMPDHEQFKSRFGTIAPTEEYIINAYSDFVKSIRNKYPKAQIICMLGNMDITRKGSVWPGYVQKAIEQLQDKKIFTFFVPYKETEGHPKTNEQKILADALIQFIDQHIQW
jgi:hypothetical protein